MNIRATVERTVTCEDCGATEVVQMPAIFPSVRLTRCTEERVEKMMASENLLIQVRGEDGQWTEEREYGL